MKHNDDKLTNSLVQPFQIQISQDTLDDLRARLNNTRWPDHLPDIGWQQGTERDWLRHLVSYWGETFDWRAWEEKLNALHHFTWEGIHFVHHRAASGKGKPLILTHGWPGSFLDYVDLLPLLEDFDVVIPSLPGYGFSPRPPHVGINYSYLSQRWHALMTALGYARYGAGGGDFGAGVATLLAFEHPEAVIGIHLTTAEITPKTMDAALSDEERSYLIVNRAWAAKERGYSAIQSTKPQTVGYALNDSPVGLAAYLGEKWYSWSDETPSEDFLCATLTLYWATQTITSSMRDYWDNLQYPVAPAYVDTPTAFGIFPNQKIPDGEPPRTCLQRLYNVKRWTVFPRGGHFAPVEEPAIVAGDITAFFRDLD